MRNLILLSSLVLSFNLQASNLDTNSPTTLVGSNLHLNTPIKISARKADAYFQFGKRVEERNVDQYYPNCNVEVYTISSTAQTLTPDSFSIKKVIEDEVYPFSGETAQLNETIIKLSSAKQPDVIRLTCSQWGNEISDGNGFLTTDEIKKALGEKFSFN